MKLVSNFQGAAEAAWRVRPWAEAAGRKLDPRAAFPDKRNFYIKNRINTERNLLKKALEGKETFRVFHPYPLEFKAFIRGVKESL